MSRTVYTDKGGEEMKEVKRTEKDGYVFIEYDNGAIIREIISQNIESESTMQQYTSDQLIMQTLADLDIGQMMISQQLTDMELARLKGGNEHV